MASPIVKWAGGKRKLLPQLALLLPPVAEIHHYAEPFVGGGAMLFHVASQWPDERKKLFRWNINDSNAALINLYNAVANNPAAVADAACSLASQHNAANYYQARRMFNSLRPLLGDRARLSLPAQSLLAGMFIYLNKCGFNGLYRENGDGDFNVPPNKNATWRPGLAELTAELMAAGEVLAPCMRTSCPYDVFIDEQISHSVERIIEPEHVFFFVDPPYLNEAQTGFTGYGKDGWITESLMLLSMCMNQVHVAGARFMMTHVDTQLVRDLFDHRDYNITPVLSSSSVSCTVGGRGAVGEIVIRNYQ